MARLDRPLANLTQRPDAAETDVLARIARQVELMAGAMPRLERAAA